MQTTRRAILAGLAAATAWRATESAAAEPPRDPLAALWTGLELQGQDGRTFQIRDLRTPVTLLHLWASWCPACLGEMAAMAAAAPSLDQRGMELVLVSHPEFWAADQAYAQRHALPFRLAAPSAANAPGVLAAALLEPGGAYVVPRSLAFGPAGRTALWSHLGALSWSSPSTIARLQALAG